MPHDVLVRAFRTVLHHQGARLGTGLGLASPWFRRKLWGAVTIESTSRCGDLRYVLSTAYQQRGALPAGDDGGTRPQPLSGRILLVDDNSEVANVTESMLGAMGLQVETDKQARHALARLAAAPTRFNLLLTDVVMLG